MRILIGILSTIWLLFGMVCYSALQPEPAAPPPWHAKQILRSVDLDRIDERIQQNIFILGSQKMTKYQRAGYYFSLARQYWLKSYMQQTRLQQTTYLRLALQQCLHAVKYNPDMPWFKYMAGDLFHQLGDFDNAEQYYVQALKIYPDEPQFRRRYYQLKEDREKAAQAETAEE